MSRILRRQLPDYMVPALFVRVEQLPLLPSGKVNRRAMPAPEPAIRTIDEPLIAPRNPIEHTLAAIWRDLLGCEQIGVHDGFFDLGGHSLVATQVISRLRDIFAIDLPLRSLFERPTIHQLSLAIVEHQIAQREDGTVPALLEQIENLSDEDAVRELAQAGAEHG